MVRKAKLFALFLGILMTCSAAMAQTKLSQKVVMPAYNNVTLGTIFNTLTQQQDIAFSYNSALLQLDSLLSVDAYQGLCIDYLEYLLGDQYAFKETNSHIIITYAPQRMQVVADIDTKGRNKAVVTGYVRDLRTDRAIAHASIYDKIAFHSATLSNKDGYFQLAIKRPENMIAITLSKENYKDTSMMLLVPVDALTPDANPSVGFYQGHDTSRNVFTNGIGKMFTSSSQRVQSMNLAGFFAYSPVQVSLTPGLSTHGFFESQVVNRFSLNIIGGSTAGVKGTELAGVFNINQYDVRGAQLAGALNLVGGDVVGLQMAGLGNIVLHNLDGVQMAGVWNKTDSLHRGFQLAGLTNMANRSDGVQLAGVVNVSRSLARYQVAGIANIAKNVKGIQVAGLVNIADSSDYPVGILNLIKNGKKELSTQIDDSRLVGVQFRSGGRVLYSVLGFGRYIDVDDLGYAAEFGLGAQLWQKARFGLATEMLQRNNFNKNFKATDVQRISLSLVPAWRIAPQLKIFMSASLVYTEASVAAPQPGTGWNFFGADAHQNSFHTGGMLGVGYVFSKK